jgi:hypothetical protein
MAKSAIIKVVALADVARLTAGMKKGSESVKGFQASAGASMAKFAAKAGVVVGAVGLVGAALTKLTKSAIEDSKSQATLAKSMQNTVGATAGQIAESEKFIKTLQTKTSIVDDQLRPSYAALVRSTQDVAQAQSLLTLATDISAGTGKDLGAVTSALAKAYNGQYTALNKLVPGINKAKDPMAQLQKQFSGMAEAAANTDPLAKMKIIFDELAETLGATLIPVFSSMVSAITPMVETLTPIITALFEKIGPILTKIIVPLAGFLEKLMEDLAPLIDIVLDLVTVLMDLLAPILDVVGMILGEVAKALVALIEPFVPLIKDIVPIFVTLLKLIMVSLKPMMGMITLLAELLGTQLTASFELLTPALQAINTALENMMGFLEQVTKAIPDAITRLRRFLNLPGAKMAPGGLTGDQQSARAADIAGLYGYGEFAKAPPKPQGGGNGAADAAKEALTAAIATLREKLADARKIISDTVAKFRDSVDTAFGLVQRGSGMIFRADRYIRELKRMKAATQDFNANLQKLRDMGGKAANPLLEQILSKSPEEAAAIMRSFAASPDMFAEAINTTNSLAATGGMVGTQISAMSGNQTQAEMLSEIKLLRSDLAAGKNTYNIKATMSAAEIVNQIRAWEKSTGKKVLAG